MYAKFKLTTFLLALILFNCKNESTFSDYKYADKPVVLTCNNLDTKLYHEALYAFEDDILNFYSKNNTNTTLVVAYSQFMRNAIYGKINYEDIVSLHTIKVFNALKNDNTLWDANNNKSHLNYNSPLMKCISINIKDKHLKTTFNALLSINSLSPKLFGAPLMTNYRDVINDKYLASYVAFDLFYARLFDVDLSNVEEKPEPKVDFNQIPK